MKAKEFLSMYLMYQGRINAKHEKVNELKERVKAISYAVTEKVQTSKQINGTARIIESYLDLEKDIITDLEELLKKQKEIKKAIKTALSGEDVELMERKYINGQSFAEISNKMQFCERQVYRKHGKALEKIDLYLKNIKE